MKIPTGFLEIDEDLFNTDGCFAAFVKGDSMVGAHILHGDCVIIRIQNQAQNSDIVAALIELELRKSKIKMS